MRKVVRIGKMLIVAVAVAALAAVLFPRFTEPLWQWANSIVTAVGQDSLPSFASVQEYAGYGLLALTLGGIVYTLWRDRRYEVLQAEYAHQTGANQLKQKVRELEKQLQKVAGERDDWQSKHADLNAAHTVALVTAKEHEVRSEYGREDREALKALREQFDDLLKQKGHTEGFREAMGIMMSDLSHHNELPNVAVHSAGTAAKSEPNGKRGRAALLYEK